LDTTLTNTSDVSPLAIPESAGRARTTSRSLPRRISLRSHVSTADARVLPKGTAIVADAGMVARYLDHLPRRFEVADGPVQFNSVMVDVDDATGRATRIERLDREYQP
jgi:hypothetical protein